MPVEKPQFFSRPLHLQHQSKSPFPYRVEIHDSPYFKLVRVPKNQDQRLETGRSIANTVAMAYIGVPERHTVTETQMSSAPFSDKYGAQLALGIVAAYVTYKLFK